MSATAPNLPKRNILIATRNQVFDPWIGLIETQLDSNQFQVERRYFAMSVIGEVSTNSPWRSSAMGLLRSAINFIGIANVEGAPYLYASDWNKKLAHKIRKYSLVSKVLMSLPIRCLNKILILIYRVLGSGISIEVKNMLNQFNPSPDLCIVMPTNMPGSIEHEVIAWSRSKKIPTVVPVMTLDNLSSKGIILDLPTFVACWNETQREYLKKYHSIPEHRILLSKSLFFSAWQSKFRSQLPKSMQTDVLRFLYVCSSARIGGYSKSPNDRAEEIKTLCKLIKQLDFHLRMNSLKGCLRIRTHPTFALDPFVMKLKTHQLRIEVASGAFPNFESEDESLLEDLHSSNYCFGINTSAMLQASLIGVKTFSLVTKSNEDITIKTPHLKQLISLGIVQVWNLEKDSFSEIDSRVVQNSLKSSQNFVGLNNSELVDQIKKLLAS